MYCIIALGGLAGWLPDLLADWPLPTRRRTSRAPSSRGESRSPRPPPPGRADVPNASSRALRHPLPRRAARPSEGATRVAHSALLYDRRKCLLDFTLRRSLSLGSLGVLTIAAAARRSLGWRPAARPIVCASTRPPMGGSVYIYISLSLSIYIYIYIYIYPSGPWQQQPQPGLPIRSSQIETVEPDPFDEEGGRLAGWRVIVIDILE